MIQVMLDDGTEIDIQISTQGDAFEAQGGIVPSNVVGKLSDLTTSSGQFLKESFQNIRSSLSDMLPDELKIEIGLSVGVEGSLVITKGKANGNIAITAIWRRSIDNPN